MGKLEGTKKLALLDKEKIILAILPGPRPETIKSPVEPLYNETITIPQRNRNRNVIQEMSKKDELAV